MNNSLNLSLFMILYINKIVTLFLNFLVSIIDSYTRIFDSSNC